MATSSQGRNEGDSSFNPSDWKTPTVFKGKLTKWRCKDWSISKWANTLPTKVQFRVGKILNESRDPLWEGDSQFVEATVQEFLEWAKSSTTVGEGNAFHGLNAATTWAYAGYKYMAELYKDNTDMLQVVDWSSFGFEGRDGYNSTIWIGSAGAHTPCHYDTYGYNLVAQLCGKKRWILYPPAQSRCLYPTRIPFEESSVYSKVNIQKPDTEIYPSFSQTTPYVVYLEPGDVLYVPQHWWHFVECKDTSLSINSWIELDDDDESRLKESITKTIMSTFVDASKMEIWLNPNEEINSLENNLLCMQEALKNCCSTFKKEGKHDTVKIKKLNLDAAAGNKPPSKRVRLKHPNDESLQNDENFIIPANCIPFSEYLILIRDENSREKTIIIDSDKQVPGVKQSFPSDFEEYSNFQASFVNSILQPDIITQIAEHLKNEWTNSLQHASND